MTRPPLVVTLTVDEESQASWDLLRRRWFPPERLKVGAHITLFHALPGERSDHVVEDCRRVASGRRCFDVGVPSVRSLGRGVALVLESTELPALHGELRNLWHEWLTPQDAAPWKPHVTVQNKVDREVAAATLTTLEADFVPGCATATGLAVWRYLGGPWLPVARLSFGEW